MASKNRLAKEDPKTTLERDLAHAIGEITSANIMLIKFSQKIQDLTIDLANTRAKLIKIQRLVDTLQ